MSEELAALRLTLVGELGARYLSKDVPLEAASRQAAGMVDRLIDAARRAPEGAPAERPEVTWDDLKVGRLVVVFDRSGGRTIERHDARIVKRGRRVGGRVTLRALTGSREWVCYIEAQNAGGQFPNAYWFRSREQVAWEDRQSAAREYLDRVIGRTATGTTRGLYTDNEVTLANILRRARGEEEL